MENIFDNNLILDNIQGEDSLSKITERKNDFNDISVEIKNGYGSCKSCSCRGYIPNDPKNDYCKNCGHHWERHW